MQGMMTPIQALPSLLIDTGKQSIAAQIVDNKGREVASFVSGKARPSGDPLDSSWNVIQALQNSLSLSRVLPGGLLCFKLAHPCAPISIPGMT